MARSDIPNGIVREHLLQAIQDIDAGIPHPFADSTDYDVLYVGRRYPPKAMVGIAAKHRAGVVLIPRDFRGGAGTKCFRVLERNGFSIVPKPGKEEYPDEVPATIYTEGRRIQVYVNRYERDRAAREACLNQHGVQCQVCEIDFGKVYGDIGAGFIHVHHKEPLSKIRENYTIDPLTDLVPVCPNCHAMLHRVDPPLTVEELRNRIAAARESPSA